MRGFRGFIAFGAFHAVLAIVPAFAGDWPLAIARLGAAAGWAMAGLYCRDVERLERRRP